MDQDEYDDQVRLRKSHRARWVAAIGGTLLILGWVYREMTEYQVEKAEQESLEMSYALSQQRYDFAVEPSAVQPEEVVVTGAPEATERLIASDRAWRPGIVAFDPAMFRDDAPPCHALADALRAPPSWIVAVSPALGMPAGVVITSSTPVTVLADGEPIPAHSPEASVRITAIAARAASGMPIPASAGDPLRTVDVLLVLGAAPPAKAAKGADAAKGAKPSKASKAATAADGSAAGTASGSAAIATHVLRAWVFDHHVNRVICGGLVPLPPATTGDPMKLDEERLRDVLALVPEVVRAVP